MKPVVRTIAQRVGSVALLLAALFSLGPGLAAGLAVINDRAVAAAVAPPAPKVDFIAASKPAIHKPNPDPDRSRRIAAVFGIIGALGAWYWVGTRGARRPRRIGPAPATQVSTVAPASPMRVAGIGKFARHRRSGPRRLS